MKYEISLNERNATGQDSKPHVRVAFLNCRLHTHTHTHTHTQHTHTLTHSHTHIHTHTHTKYKFISRQSFRGSTQGREGQRGRARGGGYLYTKTGSPIHTCYVIDKYMSYDR